MKKFHRWAGLITAVFVLLTVITGLLWAYAPHLYWATGYKEKKVLVDAPALASARLTPAQAIAAAAPQLSSEAQTVELKRDGGRLLFAVRGGEDAALVDAITGDVISPLDEALSAEFARAYVPAGSTLERVALLDGYTGRDKKRYGPAAVARYAEGGGTEIVIDRRTGAIIEDQDRVRRFHFWVMRLHQLTFFGFKKELTAIPGLSILFMLVTGLFIFRKVKRKPLSIQRP